jgi:1-acyl-sn-glycerol-3-phosphate acyltransferase
VKRPIVIFPEGTKTNGKGILSFEEDISDIILRAIDNKISVHSIRFDYEFEFNSPYNTIDPIGLKSALLMLLQVI